MSFDKLVARCSNTLQLGLKLDKVIAVFIYDFGFALFKKIVSLLGRSVDEILGFKLVLFKV